MNSLVPALGVLALSFGLTMSAAAQQPNRPAEAADPAANSAQTTAPANPFVAPLAAPVSTPQQSPLPLAEAKKRYHAAQERLQNLVKGGSKESRTTKLRYIDSDLEIEFEPRDRLRATVADTFDARRQLQQAELTELEARVARIKRALEIRHAMRDTLIDQRTDELLEQMEAGDKADQPGGAPTGLRRPNGGRASSDSTAALKEEALRLGECLDVARVNFKSAERAYSRAARLFERGVISQEALSEEERKQKDAKALLDRNVLDWEAFWEAHPDLAEKKEPVAKGTADPSTAIDVGAIDTKSRLLELAADEAIANFESAERAYRRLEKLRSSGAIEQAVLDEQIEKLALAKTQLERAAMKATLGVEEAQANLQSAERAFKRAEKSQASGEIEQSALDQQLDQYNHAHIQLDRAESNVNMFERTWERLKALDRDPDGDDPIIARTRNNTVLSAFGKSPIDLDRIVWGPKDSDLVSDRAGEPTGALQLGLDVDPKKAAYAPGDVLTARLFLKYTGKQEADIVIPTKMAERIGIDVEPPDAGEKQLWRWGPAYKKPARSATNSTTRFRPGDMQQFPNFRLVVGRAETPAAAENDPPIFAYLDAKPGQTIRLRFKLTSDVLQLATEPIELSVEERAKEPR